MKAYGGVVVFLISALVEGEWSASGPGRFNPGTFWTGGWVGHRTGFDDMERRKILPLRELKLRTLYHPARSQSLYRPS
jgi:hypothetical protein